tara:strand:+ start:11624 stop:12412 length:789 start_codon:yes stop_codon:yes gene_type:complete
MLQAKAAFEQVKLIRVCAIVVVLDLVATGLIFDVFPFHAARWIHVGVLALLVGIAAWVCIRDRKSYIRYRDEFIEGLEPGWFMVGKDGAVKRSLLDDEVQASGEQEMVSLSDQAGKSIKLAGVADVVLYLLMIGIHIPMRTTGLASNIDFRLAIWGMFLAVFVRWAVWGNAFFAGVNRLAIDPVGWNWGGWSRRLAKGGRWDNTRVLVKPMTKHGRDRYFVVMGDGDQSIGMIVPMGSVDLLRRAYANGEITPATSSMGDAH